MSQRIAVCWHAAGEFKERGFRGDGAEDRAKALAMKLLADPKVDDDGPYRVDAVNVYRTSLDGQTTLGNYLFKDTSLSGWEYNELDG